MTLASFDNPSEDSFGDRLEHRFAELQRRGGPHFDLLLRAVGHLRRFRGRDDPNRGATLALATAVLRVIAGSPEAHHYAWKAGASLGVGRGPRPPPSDRPRHILGIPITTEIEVWRCAPRVALDAAVTGLMLVTFGVPHLGLNRETIEGARALIEAHLARTSKRASRPASSLESVLARHSARTDSPRSWSERFEERARVAWWARAGHRSQRPVRRSRARTSRRTRAVRQCTHVSAMTACGPPTEGSEGQDGDEDPDGGDGATEHLCGPRRGRKTEEVRRQHFDRPPRTISDPSCDALTVMEVARRLRCGRTRVFALLAAGTLRRTRSVGQMTLIAARSVASLERELFGAGRPKPTTTADPAKIRGQKQLPSPEELGRRLRAQRSGLLRNPPDT